MEAKSKNMEHIKAWTVKRRRKKGKVKRSRKRYSKKERKDKTKGKFNNFLKISQ